MEEEVEAYRAMERRQRAVAEGRWRELQMLGDYYATRGRGH